MRRIGIDIGGTSAKLAVVDSVGRILERAQVPTGAALPASKLVRALAVAVAELAEDGDAAGLGVAAPGCRREDGEGVVNVTNLPHLDGYPLRAELEAATGLPTVLDNDANAAAMGEYRFGAGERSRRLLVATVGTGIGGGMVVNGQVFRVSWQGLGDAGHVIIVAGGPRCLCGARGCAEAVASVPAMLKAAGDRYATFGALVQAARDGEAAASSALETGGRYLGVALTCLTHVLTPERILVGGGGIDAAGDLLFEPAVAAFRDHVQPFFGERLTLDRAALGNDAGVIGAAALVPA